MNPFQKCYWDLFEVQELVNDNLKHTHPPTPKPKRTPHKPEPTPTPTPVRGISSAG